MQDNSAAVSAWPKTFPPLTPEQQIISDDFVKHWHEVLPKRFGMIERFNHTYPLRILPNSPRFRTIEIGAGIGGHLAFEDLSRQSYVCVEMRPEMAKQLKVTYQSVDVLTADCQKRLPLDDQSFDRGIAIHVLEHLPDLPNAISELARLLKPNAILSVVIPCDPGLAYRAARRISAERIFRKRYKQPYRWFIEREHINSPKEIIAALKKEFRLVDKVTFPLPLLPIIGLNLCVGLTFEKLNQH